MYPVNHPRDPLNVLVVDDNQDAADTLESLLKLWGYRVRIAYGGARALQIVAEAYPDCILLDINMPEMDGYAMARKIRERRTMKDIKLVALTAYSDEAHLRKIRESGFDCYLNKLCALTDLQQMLETCRNEKGIIKSLLFSRPGN